MSRLLPNQIQESDCSELAEELAHLPEIRVT